MPFEDDCRDAKHAHRPPDPLAAWPRFAEDVRTRLERGREAYGDRSFTRAAHELAGEVREELLDVCGWAFVLAQRIELLGARLSTAAPEAAAPAPLGAMDVDLGAFDAATLGLLERLCRVLGKPPGAVIAMALATLVAELERPVSRDENQRLVGAARGRNGAEP